MFLPIVFIPQQAKSTESTPIPSKRPETFYASPEMLKEIRRRMITQHQNKPIYQAVKSKPHSYNYEVQINEADADIILEHVRGMNLEQD